MSQGGWRSAFIVCIFALLLLYAVGCGEGQDGTTPEGATDSQTSLSDLSGRIRIDGSSTVYPITEAARRSFQKVAPRVWVRVDLSGSGRGLSKLLAGQIQIADASRSIKVKELKTAAEQGMEIIELPIALDGVSVMVNPENTWVDFLTVGELKRIWERGSPVQTWQDIRASWPDEPIMPAAPTTESGTFAYFTETVCGEAGNIRTDYYAHEDEHRLAPYISENRGGIGFFGYGWYVKYQEQLKLVPIAATADSEPVAADLKTIANGAYQPLSRPLFIYLTTETAKERVVDAFVTHYIQNAQVFVEEAGYVPLSETAYANLLERFRERMTGSLFAAGADSNDDIEKLLALDLDTTSHE